MAEESDSTMAGRNRVRCPRRCRRRTGASDSLRTFGAVVQALREHAGLSRAEFARAGAVLKTHGGVGGIGTPLPDPSFVERAEEALRNTGALRKAARHLCRQPGLAAWFRRWARLGSGGNQPLHLRMPSRTGPVTDGGVRAGGVVERATSPDEAEMTERIVARLARHELLSTAGSRPLRSASSSNSRYSNGAPVATKSRERCSTTCWT